MGWHPTVTDPIYWDADQLNNEAWLDAHPAVGMIVHQFKGLMDQPPTRVENRNRPGKAGARAGALKLGARPFTMEGEVWGLDHDDLEARKDALQDTLLIDGLAHTLKFTKQGQDAANGYAILDGATGYLASAYAAALNASSFTVEAWVLTSASGAVQSIVESRSAAGVGYALTLSATGMPQFTIAGSASAGTVAVNDGAWHHLAGTYDGTTAKLYVDGVLVDSDARTLAPNVSVGVYIGRQGYTSAQFLNGSVDEVAIYQAALTFDQVVGSYVKGRGTTASASYVLAMAPAAFWRLGDAVGSTVGGDATSNARNAAVSGVVTFTGSGTGAQQIDARIEQELVWGDPFERGVLIAASFIIGFMAHDPRRYSQVLQSAQTSAVSSDSGFAFPMTFPLTFGTSGTTGTVTIPQGGNVERGAVLRAYGPVTNPIIEDTSGLGQLVFDGLTVASGDWLEIDLDEETVYLNGDTSQNRYGYLDFTQTDWWLLPKAASTIRYRGSTISDPAKLVVEWRDAWV